MIADEQHARLRTTTNLAADFRLRGLQARILSGVNHLAWQARPALASVTNLSSQNEMTCSLLRALTVGLRALLARTPGGTPDTVAPIHLFYGWTTAGLDREIEDRKLHPRGRISSGNDALDELRDAARRHTRIGYLAAVAETERTLNAMFSTQPRPAQAPPIICDDLGILDPDLINIGPLTTALTCALRPYPSHEVNQR